MVRSPALRGGYRHQETVLDNGLTVVTVAMPHLHSATVSWFVRAGSRHERPDDNGLSHFLEHMVFRGCEAFPDSTQLNGAVEDLGGYLDGFTTRDYTGYQTTVHPDHVPETTRILAEMFRAPLFADIDIERSIVLEEMLDALDERGREIDIDVLAHRAAFGTHPLAQPIDGTRTNVRGFSVDDLERHRARLYGARNSVLCFAGRVQPRTCRATAVRAFGRLPSGRPASEGRRPLQPADAPTFGFTRRDDSQTRLRLSYRVAPDVHRDHAALVVLRRIFDGGLSARLQVELVEKRGIVYEVSADLESYSDCGLFDFELAVANEKLSFATDELLRVIETVRTGGIGEEELTRVKARARTTLEFGLDSPVDMSHWFGVHRLFASPVSPERRLAQLEAVTTADVARAARRYLSPARRTATAVGGAKPPEVRRTRHTLVSQVA